MIRCMSDGSGTPRVRCRGPPFLRKGCNLPHCIPRRTRQPTRTVSHTPRVPTERPRADAHRRGTPPDIVRAGRTAAHGPKGWRAACSGSATPKGVLLIIFAMRGWQLPLRGLASGKTHSFWGDPQGRTRTHEHCRFHSQLAPCQLGQWLVTIISPVPISTRLGRILSRTVRS